MGWMGLILVTAVAVMGVVFLVLLLMRGDKRLAERRQQIEQERSSSGSASLPPPLGQRRYSNSGAACSIRSATTRAGTCYLFESPYSGKRDVVRWESMAAFRVEGLQLPRFEIRPETAMDRTDSVLGAKDLDFDSHSELSRRFLLRAVDEAAVRSLLAPEVMAALERMDPQLLTNIEVEGGWLVAYRSKGFVVPAALRTFFDAATDVAAALPRGPGPDRAGGHLARPKSEAKGWWIGGFALA